MQKEVNYYYCTRPLFFKTSMIGGEYKCEWMKVALLTILGSFLGKGHYFVALQPKKLILSVIRTVKKIKLQCKFIIY